MKIMKSATNSATSYSELSTIDRDDLIDLQVFFEEINNKYGINIEINHSISAYENEVIAQNICDIFWKEIFEEADRFMKIYESNPTSYTTQETGERSLNPENLEYFKKIKLHPLSVIVIANTIHNKNTKISDLRNIISPLDSEKHFGISTADFAQRMGGKPESIRVRLCETGSYFGIKPYKLPNGRLLWPVDAVQKLIDAKKKH